MIFLYSFLIFLVCVFLYFLFAPLRLEIDTNTGMYRFSIRPFFYFRWVTEIFPGYGELGIFGFRRRIDFQRKSQKPKVVRREKRKRAQRKISFDSRRVVRMIRSFRIKKWLLNLDTGDMALNGRLYPVFLLLQYKTGKRFQINFCGRREFILTIENNFFRLLSAWIF